MAETNKLLVVKTVLAFFLAGIGIFILANQAGRENMRITFTNGDSQIIAIEAEVADSDSERQEGLMGRRHLASYADMLFIFDYERALHFWIKNTIIPLDKIF